MRTILLKPLFIALFFGVGLQVAAQCPDNIILNGGFEENAFSDWWNWHDNSPESYSFSTSNEAYTGDSSVVINVLEDTDLIPGGQGAEYNSRPQTNPVIGGQWYEIKFYAKSTLPNTTVRLDIKDENDGWIWLHDDAGVVGTEWTEFTSLWQADTDRPDIHLEIKIYNADFSEPYSVYFDDVTMCQTEVLTNTCSDNVVDNPGFEDGADVDWWNWHGGDETDYSFSTATEGIVGNASAKIEVLKPSDELTGAGEINSRPQTSPVVAGQNYRATVWAKSTEENTTIQLWVKDENDGWTTIGNCDLTVGTEWTEAAFVFANDTDRDDVHLEIKVFNEGFGPYEVWFDEASICATDEEPSCNVVAEPDPIFYGTTSVTTSCGEGSNLSNEFSPEDLPEDLMGWDLWDGSEDEELSTFALDPVLPYSGDASLRVDVTEGHDVSEFHHRFGNDLLLEDGQEYTVTLWMRTNIAEGDTIRAFTRAVRDTDWSAQFNVDFIGTQNEWLNYAYTFTADGEWDNAFLEIKFYRQTDFTEAYSVWLDDVQICNSSDAVVGTDNFELNAEINVFPNPAASGNSAFLTVTAEQRLDNAEVQLIDLFGRTVWTQQTDLGFGTQQIELPIENLSAGMYLVAVRHKAQLKTSKLQVINRP